MVGSCNWSIFVVSVGLQVVKCKMADLSHLFKKSFVVKICSSLKWCCNIDHEIDILCSFLEAWAGYLSKAVKPFYASQTSIFNPSDHMDTALTRCYGSLQWPDCTLSLIRDVSSKEPIGDPVDSDPDVFIAKAALSEPMVWSQRDFAIPVKLWPFSLILPVLEKYIWTNFLEKMSNHKKRWNFLVLRSTQNKWFIW